MSNFHLYQSEGQADLPVIEANPKLRDASLYEPPPGLQAAVNVALALAQPLLLTGEPGTGKTQLADHLAHFFGLGDPLVFNAQTSSTVKDLFYSYDALAHFQYAHARNNELLSPDYVEQNFIHYAALGDAIRGGERRLVLIDEIDKAPRDLPNDVLAALEKLEFSVPEARRNWPAPPAALRPIIVMTSNSEKNLPDAFLRRVVYYHIPFPDAAMLLRIVSKKVEGFGDPDLEKIVAHFESIRDDKKVKLRKKPATAELINWTALLHKISFPVAKLEAPEKLSDEERKLLLTSYSVLAKSKDDLKALDEWL
ncbi:MAG: MoxR family ATPase [Phycisphaerae bacterium]|nr:MoxR family ATPase [Saprospiraceae bacterium]